MRYLVTLAFLLLAPALALAQATDDRGRLQAFLEDNLSDAGRQVRITGFSGALSSRATIEQLTIADATGIWLTVKDVVLDWNRAALLSGRLEIAQFSAGEILMPRPPASTTPATPAPEAAGFALPDLPVSVTITKLSAGKVSLGVPVLGQAVSVALTGSAQLEAGAGKATLGIARLDRPKDVLAFSGSYSNATRHLALSLILDEGAGGIAATVLGLPGAPSLGLRIVGAGPLDAFAADLSLATDDAPRLTGRMTLGTKAQPDKAPTRVFNADVSGDITPLLFPAYQGFFGPDVRLALRGEATPDGAIRIDDLTMSSAAMRLRGQLHLSPDHWPERAQLAGHIGAPDGQPVLLPLSGPQTSIQGMDIALAYDRVQGDGWTVSLTLERFFRQALSLQQARLSGSGTLSAGDGAPIGQLDGQISLSLAGIAPREPALARALGTDLSGGAKIAWSEGAAFQLPSFVLAGSDYGLTGTGTVQGLQKALQLKAAGKLALNAADLSRFGGLAGVPLTGAAHLAIEGAGEPLGGGFDIAITGKTQDLGIGQPRLDPLLTGAGDLALRARRDATGTFVDQLIITTPATQLTADGAIRTGATSARLNLGLADAAVAVPGLDGPAGLALEALQTGEQWQVQATANGPGEATAHAKAEVIVAGAHVSATGSLNLAAASLAPYSTLTGRGLSGGVKLLLNGTAYSADGRFDVTARGEGRDLTLSLPALDPLLAGGSMVEAHILRDAKGMVTLRQGNLTTPQLTALASGTARADGGANVDFNARLRDLGLLIPDIPGPAQAEGIAETTPEGWQVDVSGTGPGGINTRVSGLVSADGSRMALALSGVAPLALANRQIAPRHLSGLARYDLALNGPAALSSLSGQITTEGARLTFPTFGLALDSLAATARLNAGQAQVEAASTVTSGGRIHLSGPVALTAPYAADLAVDMQDVGLSDPALFKTTVTGRIALNGPVAGGARISGDLSLGQMDMRVPDGGGSATGTFLEGLRHVNEPAAVRQTRQFAGLLKPADGPSAAVAYPLDVLIRAPARIFVRGRGIDAELGGQLRLAGTTTDVIPDGRFDLIRGRLDILGKRFQLTEGNASLQGSFDPVLRLVAQTTVGDVTVQIVVDGLASAPEVAFLSSPELPQDEVLSLLLFGRGLTRISPFQAVQLASAVATLAGKGGEGIVGRLRSGFGLDDLDITTDEEGATQARAGKYISDRIYTDLVVDSTGKSEINLNFQIKPNLTARGRLGSDGDTGLGVYFEKDY